MKGYNSKIDLPEVETLDPADWTSFRETAHRTLDLAIDYVEGRKDRPAWQAVPPAIEAVFHDGMPAAGRPLDQVVADVFEYILAYPTGNTHPRAWGWVSGSGTASGILAELLAATMNPVAGNFNDAASRVEEQVLRWMAELLGFPADASGVMTSGGSVANLVGIAAARQAHLARGAGGQLASAAGRLVFYASDEVHASIDKAARVLGLGATALRRVPVDSRFRIRTDALEPLIRADREKGLEPFLITGNAGSINTGSLDDLSTLADIARDEQLWLHVDGAFGALAAFSPRLRDRIGGIERADSIAFDFHKWLSVPYEAGCVLVRHREPHVGAFRVPAGYLSPLPRGTAAQPDAANLRGLQLSRGFKALKVWMTLQEHGSAKFGRIIERNVSDAAYVGRTVEASTHLELLAPVALNVVCFRFRPAGVAGGDQRDDERLNEINREVLMRVQEAGIAVPSSTQIRGRFALRFANVNHRSTRADFDHVLEEVIRIGYELLEERRTPSAVPAETGP